MNRETILSEIRRAAIENGAQPLGRTRFEVLTGISEGQWRGKFWANWSDAAAEAGIQPGRMSEAFEAGHLLALLAKLTRKRGRFPTVSEILLERAGDKTFPSAKVFQRFGPKLACVEELRRFVNAHAQFADVAQLLPAPTTGNSTPVFDQDEPNSCTEGFVYMLKLARHYKVGKTFSVPRRHREIALELPEKPDVVHSIRTDDPDGIEVYWHRRFEKKRTNGEWFALDAEDVRAFKRRKFM